MDGCLVDEKRREMCVREREREREERCLDGWLVDEKRDVREEKW